MNEALTLRAKDIDFALERVYIYDGESRNDRAVPLPKSLAIELQAQCQRVATLHEEAPAQRLRKRLHAASA
jgi:hypothetical protein